MYVCMYVYMYVCMYVCVYTYVCTPSGKTEQFTESSDCSLQSPSKGLSNGVLYSSVTVPILNVIVIM